VVVDWRLTPDPGACRTMGPFTRSGEASGGDRNLKTFEGGCLAGWPLSLFVTTYGASSCPCNERGASFPDDAAPSRTSFDGPWWAFSGCLVYHRARATGVRMISDGQQTFGHYFGIAAGFASIAGLLIGLDARRRVNLAEKQLDLFRANMEREVAGMSLGSLDFNKKLKNPYPIKTSAAKCGNTLRVTFRGCTNKKKRKMLAGFLSENGARLAGDYCHISKDQRSVDLDVDGRMTPARADELRSKLRSLKGLRVTKTSLYPKTCEV
jgi:hypothetical protein